MTLDFEQLGEFITCLTVVLSKFERSGKERPIRKSLVSTLPSRIVIPKFLSSMNLCIFGRFLKLVLVFSRCRFDNCIQQKSTSETYWFYIFKFEV